MRTTVAQLLTEEQLNRVRKIMMDVPSLQRSKELWDYLITHRQELEAKGVEPEYLAYLIEYVETLEVIEFGEQLRKNAKNN